MIIGVIPSFLLVICTGFVVVPSVIKMSLPSSGMNVSNGSCSELAVLAVSDPSVEEYPFVFEVVYLFIPDSLL